MFPLKNEETRRIARLTAGNLRAPFQKNGVYESDAEIIAIEDRARPLLCVTTDSLVEEIQSGLYDDPFFIGWMLAMVNFSDLAAVGAKPLGLLTSLVMPASWDESFVARLGAGIEAACRRLDTYVLGGDVNSGQSPVLTATAVGIVRDGQPLTRKGCCPGDRIYLSGRAGGGNAFAFLRLQSQHDGDFFQPVARIAEGQTLRGIAGTCMDTSDGVLLTLLTLSALNDCQFLLTSDLKQIVHPSAATLCAALNVSPLTALAGIHGEFELVFTVPPEKQSQLETVARTMNWEPLCLGEVLEGRGVALQKDDHNQEIDGEQLQALSALAATDAQAYIRALLDFARAQA
jgi:thiamine-monophosphate kinase